MFALTLVKIKDLLRSVLYIKTFKDEHGEGCKMAVQTPGSCVRHRETEPQKGK